MPATSAGGSPSPTAAGAGRPRRGARPGQCRLVRPAGPAGAAGHRRGRGRPGRRARVRRTCRPTAARPARPGGAPAGRSRSPAIPLHGRLRSERASTAVARRATRTGPAMARARRRRVALLPSTGPSAPALLIVLDVSRTVPGAQALPASAGRRGAGSYRRHRACGATPPARRALRFVAALPRARRRVRGVRAAIDAAAGARRRRWRANSAVPAGGGAASPPAGCSTPTCPAAGVAAPAGRRDRGGRGALGVLLYRPALAALAMSSRPRTAGRGSRSTVRARLEKLEPRGGRRRRSPPTLQSVLPAGSTPMPRRRRPAAGRAGAAQARLRPAASAARRAACWPARRRAHARRGSTSPARSRLFVGESGGRDLARPVRPALVIVARSANQAAARTELAVARGAARAAVPAHRSEFGSGAVPGLDGPPGGGVTAHQLPARLGLQLDYAVFDGLAVVIVHEPPRRSALIAHAAHALSDDAGLPGGARRTSGSRHLATLSRLQPAPQPRRADRTDARRARSTRCAPTSQGSARSVWRRRAGRPIRPRS